MSKFNWMNFLGKTMSAAGNAFSGNQGNQMQGGMQGGMMDQGQMTPGQMLGTGIGRMVNSFMENRARNKRKKTGPAGTGVSPTTEVGTVGGKTRDDVYGSIGGMQGGLMDR